MTGKLLPLRRISGVPVEMSDDALIAACTEGDTAALGALFDRYGPAVHGFVRRLVPGELLDEVDDLVQTTFETIVRSSRRDRDGSARAWLFGIAHNVVRHHLRSVRRRQRMTARLELEPPGISASPHQEVSVRHDLARLGAALASLPYGRRSAFVLCYLEGLTGAEAAQVLNVREGTIWKRLHQAREQLRRLLDDGDADDR